MAGSDLAPFVAATIRDQVVASQHDEILTLRSQLRESSRVQITSTSGAFVYAEGYMDDATVTRYTIRNTDGEPIGEEVFKELRLSQPPTAIPGSGEGGEGGEGAGTGGDDDEQRRQRERRRDDGEYGGPVRYCQTDTFLPLPTFELRLGTTVVRSFDLKNCCYSDNVSHGLRPPSVDDEGRRRCGAALYGASGEYRVFVETVKVAGDQTRSWKEDVELADNDEHDDTDTFLVRFVAFETITETRTC